MTLSEHRAAARIAWRHARRAKGRSALIVALVALPVMTLALAGIMIHTAIASPEDRATGELGSADMQIDFYGGPGGPGEPPSPTELERALPTGTRIGYIRETVSSSIIGGSLGVIQVVEPLPAADQAPQAARYLVRRGRAPHVANEVAMSARTMKTFRARIGDDLKLDDLKLTLHVVGEVVQREYLTADIAIVGPGTLEANQLATPYGWLIDLPPGTTVEQAQKALAEKVSDQISYVTRADLIRERQKVAREQTGASFGGAAAALFATGLIAAAAFGVGARRQLRALGLVGAAGGEPRHVRAIVLWGGAVLGLIGSVVGVATAVAVAYASAPYIGDIVGRVIGAVRLPWPALVGAVVLGTIASTLSALTPARQAAELSTIDALAARYPGPRAPGRLARRGLYAVIGGSLATGLSTAWHDQTLLAIALVVMLSGFLVSIPLLVTWVGRAPKRMPTPFRLAARQTARYGRRTGAAVAAATMALTAPIALAAYTLSDEGYNNRTPLMADDQMWVGTFNPLDQGIPPDAILDAARKAIPGSVVARIHTAGVPAPKADPNAPQSPLQRRFVEQAQGMDVIVETSTTLPDGSVITEGTNLYIGDADTLRAVHAESALKALEEGKAVAVGQTLSARAPKISVYVPASNPGDLEKRTALPAVSVPGPAAPSEGIPRYLISEAAAAKLGYAVGAERTALMRSPHPLTKDDIAKVKRAMARIPGAYAQSKADLMTSAGPVRMLATAGACVLALMIVAVAVVLVSAESRREHAILAAVGAEPKTRRRIVASSAFLVAGLAGVLAVPAGFLPVAVILFARRAGYPIIAPWGVMALVALAAPVFAGLVAAAVSRQPSSRALLQPVW